MMEFTLSRVTLVICGAILIASVAVPISGVYEDRTDESLAGMAEKTAAVIDSFWNSDIDSMYLEGDALLPSPEYSLCLEGYGVTVTDGSGNEYRSYMKHMSGRITLSKGEVVVIVKDNGVLNTPDRISQISENQKQDDGSEKSSVGQGDTKVSCGPKRFPNPLFIFLKLWVFQLPNVSDIFASAEASLSISSRLL